jgi:hypothetical protein
MTLVDGSELCDTATLDSAVGFSSSLHNVGFKSTWRRREDFLQIEQVLTDRLLDVDQKKMSHYCQGVEVLALGTIQ